MIASFFVMVLSNLALSIRKIFMCCFSLKRRFAFLWHALPQGEAHSVRRTLFAWRVLCTNALGSYTRSSGVNFALAEMPLRGRGLRQLRAFRVLYMGNLTWLLSRISISILFRLFSSPRALSVDRLLFYALFFFLSIFPTWGSRWDGCHLPV